VATVAFGETKSGIQHAVQYGYEDAIQVQLYYYHPFISGTAGKGVINDADLIDGYETPNAALIPLSDLIYTYKEVRAVRIDSTVHDPGTEGAPEIMTNAGAPANTKVANGLTVLEGLQKFYDINLVYENPNNPSAAEVLEPYVPAGTSDSYYYTVATTPSYTGRGKSKINATWPATDGMNSGSRPTTAVNSQIFYEGTDANSGAFKEGDFIYDNSAADEAETRDCTVRVLEPLSAAIPVFTVNSTTGQITTTSLRRTREDVELTYRILP